MTATVGLRPESRTEPGNDVAVVTADGHEWTWPELFETFAPPIRSFAISRGARTPDDVVQDVFLVAVEKLHRFEGDRSGLRSLLFTLAYRKVSDEHRRRYRRPELLVSTHGPMSDSGPQVDELVAARDSVDQALSAFSVLDARERDVLEMRIFQEATPAQVAAAIGTSRGNVRVIQARALAKVRSHLDSTRTDGTSRKLGSASLVFVSSIRYLGARLPNGGRLGEWIEDLRRTPTGMGGATVAAGTGAAIGTAATAVSGPKLTALVVALAVATLGSGAVVTGSESTPSTVPVDTAESLIPSAHPERGEVTGESGDAPAADLGEMLPTTDPVTDVPEPADADSGIDGLVPATDDQVEPAVRGAASSPGVDPIVEEVVEPVVGVVDGVVDPVVGDLVEPVVREVEDVVGEVVDPVARIVDGVAGPLVEDLIGPQRDSGLGRLLDSQLDPILGGLLGG